MPDPSALTPPTAVVSIEARLTHEQRISRDAHVRTVKEYQAKSVEAAVALAAIKEEQLYLEDGNFSDFARKRFGIGSSRAYQLAAAGLLYEELREAGVDPLPTSEAQLRPLGDLDALDDKVTAWKAALKKAGGRAERVTMEDVRLAAEVQAEPQDGEAGGSGGDVQHAATGAELIREDIERRLVRFGPDAARIADVAGSIASGDLITADTLQAAIDGYEEVLAADGSDELPVLVGSYGALGEAAPDVVKSEDGRNELLVSVPAAYYREAPEGARTVLVPKEDLERGLERELDAALIAELQRGAAEAGYHATFNRTNEHVDWAWWTWNPLTGCAQGCVFCYAREIANRFYPQGFAETFHPGRLNAPANARVPKEAATNPWARNVFTVSMGDLFRSTVSPAIVHAVLGEIAAHPKWEFLLLTKFAKRLPEFEFPDNAWVGTSIVSQEWVKPAEAAFSEVEARVKWISAEPLLGPLEFERLDLFDWIVIGSQSKTSSVSALQPERAWVESLKRQAREAGVAIYEKENLALHLKEFPKT